MIQLLYRNCYLLEARKGEATVTGGSPSPLHAHFRLSHYPSEGHDSIEQPFEEDCCLPLKDSKQKVTPSVDFLFLLLLLGKQEILS